MTAITARPSPARERLLLTASAIFYAEGIHDVGVDRIIEQAAVTRSTFYRHFAGKEQLVVAYIEATDLAVRAAVQMAAGPPRANPPGSNRPDAGQLGPVELIRVLTAGMGAEICRPGFRGCAFINAAAEYPDPASPVRQAVLAHRDWLQHTVSAAFRRAGHGNPAQAAQHFMMLRDGAMVAGYLHSPDQARQTLDRGVDTLLATL